MPEEVSEMSEGLNKVHEAALGNLLVMATHAAGTVVNNSAHSSKEQATISHAATVQGVDHIYNASPLEARAAAVGMTENATASTGMSVATAMAIAASMINAGYGVPREQAKA